MVRLLIRVQFAQKIFDRIPNHRWTLQDQMYSQAVRLALILTIQHKKAARQTEPAAA